MLPREKTENGLSTADIVSKMKAGAEICFQGHSLESSGRMVSTGGVCMATLGIISFFTPAPLTATLLVSRLAVTFLGAGIMVYGVSEVVEGVGVANEGKALMNQAECESIQHDVADKMEATCPRPLSR